MVKEGLVILERIIQGLHEDLWSIEKDGNQWIMARKGENGLLFSFLRKGAPLEGPQGSFAADASIKHWEAIILCPEGLSSQDLKQPALKSIQAWFIDLQTGSIFAAPATAKREHLNRVLSYLEVNSSSSASVYETSESTPSARRGQGPPYLTYTLIAINLIVFGLMTLAGGSTRTGVLIFFGAKVNALIIQGEYWRLFTSMFLHIGFLHLAFNLYALWALGAIAEELLGRVRYITVYILSGILGSVASFFFTDAISAGASGAIFGILGALVVYSRRKPFLWKSGFGKSLAVVVLINLGLGFFQTGIDVYAHLGGLVTGMLFTWLISMK